MPTTETIRQRLVRIKKGEPFTNARFLRLGSRAAVDKALSRFVQEGLIHRIARGVFVRPKRSRFVGIVMPDTQKVVEAIAKNHGETIQVHGAEAARRFRLTTQVPTIPVYYTSGPSRELKIGNLTVKLKHVSPRKLRLSGTRPGLALSTLWYLGKEAVNTEVLQTIRNELSSEEFEMLRNIDMPAWMSDALHRFDKDVIDA